PGPAPKCGALRVPDDTTTDGGFFMRIAYLDCFSGISGDMFLGALVDAGVPVRVLEEAVAALRIGASLRVTKVDRSGITATKVDVLVDGEPDRPRDLHSHAEMEESQSSSGKSAGNTESKTPAHGRHEHSHPAVAGFSTHEHKHSHEHGEAHSHSHHEHGPQA